MNRPSYKFKRGVIPEITKTLDVHFDGGGSTNNISIGVWCPTTGYKFGMTRISSPEKNLTTNSAEWNALICAMHYALGVVKQSDWENVRFLGDSQLIVNQASQAYKIRDEKFLPFFRETQELKRELEQCVLSVSYEWIPRKENKQADLAGHLIL